MIELSGRNKHESAKEYVMRELTDNIVNVRLEPGEKILDQQLCTQFGVSRTPFREAQLELAQRKLIRIVPKIGTYVSYIDPDLVEQVRQLRSVLESELAVMACGMLTGEDVDRLWENVALWKLYIDRKQESKIFSLDKEFHSLLYRMCGRGYWHELVESVAPHFDRTTVLSFRCKPVKDILRDHEELTAAIERKDAAAAREISRRHMTRYTENIETIRRSFPAYFEA